MNPRWKTMLSVTSFALAVLYLSGSAGNAVLFMLFLAAWLLPASFVIWLMLRNFAMEKEILCLLSFSGAIVIATPYWFLRNLSGVPFPIIDLAVGLGMAGLVIRSRHRGEFVQMLRELVSPREEVWIGMVLPALFCVVWLGFEVHHGRQVLYHGLFPVDFCNLSSMVSLLKASPGLPLDPVEGQGLLHYHWFFFTLPALLSTFLGAGMSSSHALMLSNLISAILLFKMLSYANSRLLIEGGLPCIPLRDTGAGLTILASSVMHFYYGAVSVLHLAWLTPGQRNGLLMALPNSMTAFGNNTFALILSLLFFCCLDHWQKQGRIVWVILAALCSSLVAGYSITLCFALALVWVLMLAFRMIRQPLRVFLPATIIGLLMFFLFAKLGFFSGGKGSPALAFDSGRYLANFVCSFPLLVIGIILAIRFQGGWLSKAFLLGLASSLVVPTLLYIKDSPSGAVDFSMKTSSLMIVLAGPLTVYGICQWHAVHSRSRVCLVALYLLIAMGLLHSAAYAGQYAYYRFFNPEASCVKVDADYFNALNYIRLHSQPGEIVLDGSDRQCPTMMPVLLIAERRLLFVNMDDPEKVETGRTEGMAGIWKARWQEWAGAGYPDTIAAGYFAALADDLITTKPMVSAAWVPAGRFGDIYSYKSARRSGFPPANTLPK